MSTTLMPAARPRPAAARSPRLRRSAVAIALSAALAGGTLVAGAGTATAAPAAPAAASATQLSVAGAGLATAKKATPKVSVKLSRTSGQKGKAGQRPVYKVKATKGGKAVQGNVKIFINGKKINTKKLNKSGAATLRPTWGKYKVGKNKIRVTVVPAKKTGLAKVKTHRTVSVKAKATSGSKVVNVANKYVGSRYRSGGTSPSTGFDCSGFTSYVYKKATGKKLPRTSSAQSKVGKKVSRSNAKPGDLVYTPGHVAIYAGNGKVIEAARPGVGVVKRSIWQKNPTFIRV